MAVSIAAAAAAGSSGAAGMAAAAGIMGESSHAEAPRCTRVVGLALHTARLEWPLSQGKHLLCTESSDVAGRRFREGVSRSRGGFAGWPCVRRGRRRARRRQPPPRRAAARPQADNIRQ
jgi:hypothetical protein